MHGRSRLSRGTFGISAAAAALLHLGCASRATQIISGTSVDRALRASAGQRALHGAVVIATERGERLQRAQGWADREQKKPFRDQTRFVIGSLSKQLTAALVLREVDGGRLRLDDTIGKHPFFDAPWAGQVQVRHLLNHTSGIEALDKPLKHPAGVTFEYSNFGYDLLGKLVQRTTGTSYSAALQSMLATCDLHPQISAAPTGNLAVPYAESTEGAISALPIPREVIGHSSSGGLVASADDLVAWSQCLHRGQALAPESYRSMITSSATRQHRWGELGYGFGVQISQAGQLLEVSHSGYVPGFVSTLIEYPEQCVTVVILENLSTPTSDMARAFAPHDSIRKAVREELTRSDATGCNSAG